MPSVDRFIFLQFFWGGFKTQISSQKDFALVRFFALLISDAPTSEHANYFHIHHTGND